MWAALIYSLEEDTGKILALVRFYPQLEPEYALRHELYKLSKSGAITFTFILEEATDFIYPAGMAACSRTNPASPFYNGYYLTLPLHSRRALIE